MLSVDQIATKWSSKAGGAGNDYKNGIQGVQQAPGQAAVAAQGTMVAKWNESVQSGRWAARTGSVSLEQWKQQAMGKGAANYGNGISAGKQKYQAAIAYYAPYYQQAREAAKQFPRDGAGGSLARVQSTMQILQAAKAARR
jgi:hypothetical protein